MSDEEINPFDLPYFLTTRDGLERHSRARIILEGILRKSHSDCIQKAADLALKDFCIAGEGLIGYGWDDGGNQKRYDREQKLLSEVIISALALGVKIGSENPSNAKQLLSKIQRAHVEKRHNAEGGAREKARRIREIWASGKYSSRDVCAEQECANLGMAFSTARKALRNTPQPSLKTL